MQELKVCMAAIVEAAKRSPEIMPVARSVQDRRAMNSYFAERPEDPYVVRYKN